MDARCDRALNRGIRWAILFGVPPAFAPPAIALILKEKKSGLAPVGSGRALRLPLRIKVGFVEVRFVLIERVIFSHRQA